MLEHSLADQVVVVAAAAAVRSTGHLTKQLSLEFAPKIANKRAGSKLKPPPQTDDIKQKLITTSFGLCAALVSRSGCASGLNGTQSRGTLS